MKFTKICLIICSIAVIIQTDILAQKVSSKYTTASITSLMVKFNQYDNKDRAFEKGFEQINLSNKYFNNEVPGKLVLADGRKKYIANFKEEIKRYTPREDKLAKRVMKNAEYGITSAILGEKALLNPTDSLGLAFAEILEKKINIGEDIFKIWSQKDNKGNFVTLNQRSAASLNTTDIQNQVDYNKLDVFKDLLFKNYIILFDFGDIINATRYADQFPGNAGLSVGMADYVVEVNTYVYKLDIDDLAFEQIKKNFNSGDFSAIDLPIKYVGRYLSVAESGFTSDSAKANESPIQKKERIDQVQISLAQKAYNEIIELAEMKIEDFKLRTKVTSGFPNKIKAQIGLKENVKLDQRYFVYENELNEETGQQISVLKSVIRTSQTVDNRDENMTEKGEFKETAFYQVWGDPVKEGMFLVQENDFGVGLSAGMRTMRQANFNMRIEYRISQWLKKGWKSSPLVNTNIYVDIFFADASFNTDLEAEVNLSTGMGLSSKFYINKWIRPEPYIGYYILQGFNFINLGVRFDYPIKHNIFIVPELGISTAKGKNDNFSPIVFGVSLKHEL